MIDVTQCPLCQSKNLIPYQSVFSKPRIVFESPVGKLNGMVMVNYASCTDCGYIFQTPRLAVEELQRYYADGHYRKWLDVPQEALDQDEYQRALSVMESIKTLGELKSHLDVGCSRGYLLELSDMNGTRSVLGVEPNQDYVMKQKENVVASMALVDTHFDLVTSIHVLEHVTDPMAEVKSYADHTKQGGYLIVEVPSAASQGGPLRLAHLSFFLPHVLKQMLVHVGYQIESTLLTPHLRIIAKKL